MSFKIDIIDHEDHYYIEEVEGKYVLYTVKPEFEEIRKFNKAVEAIKYVLIKMGRLEQIGREMKNEIG